MRTLLIRVRDNMIYYEENFLFDDGNGGHIGIDYTGTNEESFTKGFSMELDDGSIHTYTLGTQAIVRVPIQSEFTRSTTVIISPFSQEIVAGKVQRKFYHGFTLNVQSVIGTGTAIDLSNRDIITRLVNGDVIDRLNNFNGTRLTIEQTIEQTVDAIEATDLSSLVSKVEFDEHVIQNDLSFNRVNEKIDDVADAVSDLETKTVNLPSDGSFGIIVIPTAGSGVDTYRSRLAVRMGNYVFLNINAILKTGGSTKVIGWMPQGFIPATTKTILATTVGANDGWATPRDVTVSPEGWINVYTNTDIYINIATFFSLD